MDCSDSFQGNNDKVVRAASEIPTLIEVLPRQKNAKNGVRGTRVESGTKSRFGKLRIPDNDPGIMPSGRHSLNQEKRGVWIMDNVVCW